jgi:hypothetical protein
MSFAMHFASMYAGHYHFVLLFVVQVDAGFHTTERPRHVIHDAVDELVKVQNRCDLLCGPLHPLQIFNEIGLHSASGENLAIGD